MIEIHAEVFDRPPLARLLEKYNLETGGKVQQLVDKLVIDYAVPYCPFDTGILATSPYAATVYGSGVVIYPGPYAHYQYYGEVYGPNIWNGDQHVKNAPSPWFSPAGQKKHPTGRALQYDRSTNPLAGSFWINRMKADRARDIAREAERFARKAKRR